MSTSTGLNMLNTYKRSMKVNRIAFDKINAQHQLLKMRAAFILAEEFLINKESDLPEEANYWDGEYTISTSLTPEEFNKLNKQPSPKELVHQQLLVLEAQLKDAEDREEYESCEAIMQAIKILRRKFINL